MGKKKSSSKRGSIGFDSFYRNLYGPRWDDLSAALREESFPLPFTEGLQQAYFMDRASIETARLLGALPGERVLDMCAAPGGKSLVLASMMKGEGVLICNDRSSGRRARLRRVLEEHLPPEFMEMVKVTSHDATRWGLYEQEAYDRILLDAPCSSERHLLSDQKYLDAWSPARTRHLAIQAFSMAVSALDALKTGGVLLYSTCTISENENDGVITKLLKRRKGMVELMEADSSLGEKTSCGMIVLPDRCRGLGPMYLALLKKNKAKESGV